MGSDGGQMVLPGMDRLVKAPHAQMRDGGPSETDQIVAFYQGLRGPLVFACNVLVQKKHAKAMLVTGYALDEIKGCIRWLHDSQQYNRLNWSLAFVAKMLPQYRREHQVCVMTGPSLSVYAE